MKTEAEGFLPKVRSEGIITKEADGELLIYDRRRDKAHCLNESAAAVWKLCDGRTSVGEMSEQLAEAAADGSRQTAAGSTQKAVGRSQTADGFDPAPDTRHPTPNPSDTLPPTPDTQIIWLALEQLRSSHLLEEPNGKAFWPASIPGIANMSRREAVRRIGLGAAIALPIVISMTAPTAVQASVSCGGTCQPCTTPADCCGVCSNSNVPGCPTGTPRCT